MAPLDYELVFDIAQTGYREWPGVAFGLVFMAIGLGLLFHRKRIANGRHPMFAGIFISVWLAFATLWTMLAAAGTWTQYVKLRDARDMESFAVVEGTVSEFLKPMENHKRVGFVVGGTRFEYSPYGFASSFNEWHWYGGPIENGLRVRIGHVDGAIVKLEVAR